MPIRRLGHALRRRIASAHAGPFGPAPQGVALMPGGLWRPIADDPQFVFGRPPARTREIALHLEAERDGALTPRLYFDWGHGFSESDSCGLAAARAALIRIDLTGCADLRGLRLDPLEGRAEFAFRWGADDDAERLARETEPQFAALETQRAPLLRARLSAADYAPASVKRPFGRLRKPRTPHDHFLHAAALAAAEPSLPPPPRALLFSFVCPLYNTPVAYLDDLLASFRQQAPGYAELVLSDDGSTSPETARWLAGHETEPGLVVVRNPTNRGIAAASNAGIAACNGRFVGFVDHDDALSPHAVAVLARAVAANPRARFFYTDEAIADKRLRVVDFFDKPAFDHALLSGVNYINHLSLYARDLLRALGGFREGFDGSQDYDLLLRATRRLDAQEIRHIPYPAYVWRRDGQSYSVKFIEKATASARRALADAYDGAAVAPALLPDLHRVAFAAPRRKVSIVTPNRDSFRLMSVLAESLYARTEGVEFEWIVIDNGSTDPDTLALYERLSQERPGFTLSMRTAPFNFSAQINEGAARASGEALLLLNNDIETTEPDWLAEMLSCLAYPNVGVVGARLLYPSGLLQHAGVCVGLGGLAGHWYTQRPADYSGPMGRLAVRSTVSAVTGACMLISRECWEATGPFDAENFAVAYNDVDFCLRARQKGFRTLYTPFATLIHHESATRGTDAHGPNRPRFLRDQAALIERHGTDRFDDPHASPWRDRVHAEPRHIALERLPAAR